MDPSDFALVKRAADRTILPVALAMTAVAAASATAAFMGVLWAWGSELPDWAYDATTLLPEPLVALVLLLVYLAGRWRIQRRVTATAGERGYELMAHAGRRGALRRYNVCAALLGVALLIACVFYLSYLSTMLYEEDEDDWENASPTTAHATAPGFPLRDARAGHACRAQPPRPSSSVQRSRACISSSSICA